MFGAGRRMMSTENISGDDKSTEAFFEPWQTALLHKPSALEWLAILGGIGLCSTGIIGIIIGAPLAFYGIVSGFFIRSRIVRGTWFGLCPNCGVKMSVSIYTLVADCPGCHKNIVREGNRLKVERTTASS